MNNKEVTEVPKFFIVHLTKEDIQEIVWSIQQTLHSKSNLSRLSDLETRGCGDDSCDWCKGQKTLIETVSTALETTSTGENKE